MGLLEKAQHRKQEVDETKYVTETITVEESKPLGLLEKARHRKQKILKVTTPTLKKTTGPDLEAEVYPGLQIEKEGKLDIIEESSGLGWKGLGSRRVVFDHSLNEHRYEVSEPILNEKETEIKNELTRLFKMLADINVYDMDKEEKKKYLKETLERIIVDNDVKFDLTKIEKPDKKSFLSFFAHKKGKNKEKVDDGTKTEKKVSTKKTKKVRK